MVTLPSPSNKIPLIFYSVVSPWIFHQVPRFHLPPTLDYFQIYISSLSSLLNMCWWPSSSTAGLAIPAHCHMTSSTQIQYSSRMKTFPRPLSADSLTAHLKRSNLLHGDRWCGRWKCFRFLDFFCFLSWYWTSTGLAQWKSWHESSSTNCLF